MNLKFFMKKFIRINKKFSPIENECKLGLLRNRDIHDISRNIAISRDISRYYISYNLFCTQTQFFHQKKNMLIFSKFLKIGNVRAFLSIYWAASKKCSLVV